MNNTTEYFKPLTGLRALAAYMVFIMHYNCFPANSIFFAFFSQFYTGVSVFFVLSGFLITYRYMNVYSITTNWFIKYIKNRFARIYPLYFLLTTITLIVSISTITNSQFTFEQIFRQNLWVYVSNLTFIRGFFNDLLFTLVSQGWSLTVEEIFYLTAPLMLYFQKKIPLIVQSVFFCILGYVLVKMGEKITFYGFFDSDIFMLKFTFFGRAFQFICGMLMAQYVMKIKKPKNSALFNKTYLGFIIIIASLCILTICWKRYSIYYSIFTDNIILSIGVALLIGGLVQEKTFISKFLSWNIMELLGKSSYAFYLIHLGVLHLALQSFGVSSILVTFFIFNVIALALYNWVESPLRKYIINIQFN